MILLLVIIIPINNKLRINSNDYEIKTIINGKLVMENRKIEGIDKEKIYKKCIQIIDRIQ